MSERFKQSHSIPACCCLGGLLLPQTLLGSITPQVAMGQRVQEPAQGCHTVQDTIPCCTCVPSLFCLYFSTFSLLEWKKPSRCLENCRMLLLSSGALWPLWHRAGALPVCFCPDEAEAGADQPPQDEKQQKNIPDCVSQHFCTSILRLGHLPTPPRHKAPSCQCRTGNSSPVQCQAADTENVLKPPLLLPKTFKLFRALGPTPSKNTNKHSMKSEPHSPSLLIPRCPHRRYWRRTKAH